MTVTALDDSVGATHLVVSDWEEDESTSALNEKRLFLFWKVYLADELAMELVSGVVLLGDDFLDRLAVGQESWLGKVIRGWLGRWSRVDVDVGHLGGNLLGGCLWCKCCGGSHLDSVRGYV